MEIGEVVLDGSEKSGSYQHLPCRTWLGDTVCCKQQRQIGNIVLVGVSCGLFVLLMCVANSNSRFVILLLELMFITNLVLIIKSS